MKIRITKPVSFFPQIPVGNVYEAYEDRDGDFIFDLHGEQILVLSRECEVIEESEKVVVTGIGRDDRGDLVATIEPKEELYKITFVKNNPYSVAGMVNSVSYIGKGRPSLNGNDVFIYTPDGAQIIVDRGQFQSFRVEPYIID